MKKKIKTKGCLVAVSFTRLPGGKRKPNTEIFKFACKADAMVFIKDIKKLDVVLSWAWALE